MIPFGMFHPDSAGVNAPACIVARNVLPGANGFLPLPSLVAGTSALDSACRGAISVLKDDGHVEIFAGTQTGLFNLSSSQTWTDVSRVSGGDYQVGAGEQWKFALYGTRLLATNVFDDLQYIDLVSGSNFAAVSGSPPRARYIDVVREFVLLGSIADNEKRVQWSANGNSESWTPGTGESDYQDLPNGGPVRGVIGGEVGYLFQAQRVTRMTYVPGSPVIFQFDEVEGASGLNAPHSLVRLRGGAYYLAQDGFRAFSLAGGASQPIGVKKWVKWFLADIKPGSELLVQGAVNPVKPIIVWSYISRNNATSIPDRMLIYDFSLDEATYADVSVEALMQWLSPGVTLDTMNDFGNLDSLQFSLDSPFWKGGAGMLGIIGTDHALSLQTGSAMAAQIVTGDGQAKARTLIKGTRPQIDAATLTVEIATRERVQDPVSYNPAEALEDTGIVPAHASGNLARARISIPAAATWTQAQGIETVVGKMGQR